MNVSVIDVIIMSYLYIAFEKKTVLLKHWGK
jgi:hypothetical protein